jgi:hypothetical protein
MKALHTYYLNVLWLHDNQHCIKNQIYVFPKMKLLVLVPITYTLMYL